MNEESTVLRIYQEYNMNIDKTSVNCSETHLYACLRPGSE